MAETACVENIVRVSTERYGELCMPQGNIVIQNVFCNAFMILELQRN